MDYLLCAFKIVREYRMDGRGSFETYNVCPALFCSVLFEVNEGFNVWQIQKFYD